MKTTKPKAFDTVAVFRAIKEEVARETEKMSFAEFKQYLQKNSLPTANQALLQRAEISH